MTRKSAERQESINQLRQWLNPGDTVHTILRKVSRSGMSRVIEPIFLENNDAMHIGYHVGKALDRKTDDHGVRIGGCGMDMGFALVYELSHALWPNGFDCIGEGCPSNDHRNHSCICEHNVSHTEPYCPDHGHLSRDQMFASIDGVYECKLCKRDIMFKCGWPTDNDLVCECRKYQRKPAPNHHESGGYALRQRWL